MGMLFSCDYLWKPVRTKISSDQSNEKLSYGASSMQGWREEQEDAHNHILDFDTNASLFAVYDGHGGPEVAEYSAIKLPEFLKALDAYKSGDIEKALIDAFLGLDATITSSEVIAELTIASLKSKERVRHTKQIDREEIDKDDRMEKEKRNRENLQAEITLEKIMAKPSGDVKKEVAKPEFDKKEEERAEESSESSSCDSEPEKIGLEVPEIRVTESKSVKENAVKLEIPKNDKSKNTKDGKVAEENQNGKVISPEKNYDDDDTDSVDSTDSSPAVDESRTTRPGYRSGCTAIVALLVGNELYVANAGDSRCIICRNGKAEEMSFDHKPGDGLERARVVKAGGWVREGRVEGDLNLSRAFGDHRYKGNSDLSDREQMITALPDVKRVTVEPGRDEFMVVACDGIWNSMSNDEVVEFVRTRLQAKDKPTNLSQICEEMFDQCLAPKTGGGIAGCDNMTCIIVEFKPALIDSAIITAVTPATVVAHKRRDYSPISDEPFKKPKTAESSTTKAKRGVTKAAAL